MGAEFSAWNDLWQGVVRGKVKLVAKATLMVVDDHERALERTRRELESRYSTDYEVMCEASPAVALEKLAALKRDGGEAAIIFADLWMEDMTGVEFLKQAHDLHPYAKRVLLIDWGDRVARSRDLIMQAMTFGWIDYYIRKPFTSPDEYFHRFVTELLDGWRRQNSTDTALVSIIGERWSERAYELRDVFNRFNVPFRFYEPASEAGKALLEQAGCPEGPFPVLVLLDNRVLMNPANEEIADALGVTEMSTKTEVDLAIIGAGPAGLSAAVYGASEGLETLVIERQVIGGQAGTSPLIRNYLGFPNGISGGEMAKRAYSQAWLFGADFYLLHNVVNIRSEGDWRVLTLSDGTEIRCKAVVLAMGVAYRRLSTPTLDSLLGAGVFYGSTMTEAQAMKGQRVFVAGAGNSAGQAALHMARYAEHVTIVVRGDSLAAKMSDYLVKEVEAALNISVLLNTVVVDGCGERRLEGLELQNRRTGETWKESAAALFVLIGADPCTEWLPNTILRDRHGYVLTGTDMLDEGETRGECEWELERHPARLETSIPGVFAIGDVRARSMKRVAAAVGEGGTVISLVHEYLSTLAVPAGG